MKTSNQDKIPWQEIERTLQEIVDAQKQKVLSCGRRIVSTLTPEDVLQPNDYPELENNPLFRYEEGVLEGVQTVQMALVALLKEGQGKMMNWEPKEKDCISSRSV